MLPFTEENMNDATKITNSCQLEMKKVEKLKAVHFPMYMLMIGFFKVYITVLTTAATTSI